jgi:hypothetical protein
LWAIQGITPFGSLLIGYLAQRYGLPLTLRLVALLCLSGMAGVKRGSARPRDSLPG